VKDRCGRGTARYDSFRNRRRADLRTKDGVRSARSAVPKRCSAISGYTHRIAIGNERLPGCENDEVRLRWQDYAHGSKTKVMYLPVEEFIRRRTGRSPAFMRYRMNPCASPLRRRLRPPPQAALRSGPPLTPSRPLTILHPDPKLGVRAGRSNRCARIAL